MRASHALPILALLLAGCASPTAPGLTGQWGGDQMNLSLTSSGGAAEYGCGLGTIDSGWTLTAGRLTATGKHYTEGGPVPIGGFPPHPARYDGTLVGSRLDLTVTLTDLGISLGPFKLMRGRTVRLVKCL